MGSTISVCIKSLHMVRIKLTFCKGGTKMGKVLLWSFIADATSPNHDPSEEDWVILLLQILSMEIWLALLLCHPFVLGCFASRVDQ